MIDNNKNNDKEKKKNIKLKETLKKKSKSINNKFETSRFNGIEVVILLVIVSLVSIVITIVIKDYQYKDKNQSTISSSDFSEFIETYNYINSNYYKDINKKDLINGAIKGMLEAVGDPYTTLLDDNQSNTIDVLLQGSYEGLGIMVSNDSNNNIYITGIVEDSPASKSDLKVGDKLIKVNNKSFEGKKTSDLITYIKNSKETKFSLVVIRDEKEITIEVERKYIELKSVTSKVIEQSNKKIGYIYVSLFANNTDIQFSSALDDLEKSNIDSLIIDVRDNSGGHLTAVTNMISKFVDSKHIIYKTEENNKVIPYYSNGDKTKEYPIVILINNNSASASEVLAGSLRDNLNATLIGETSFGKGTVQELITLPDGSYYKVTTKKWLTPKETWVNEKGLQPDKEVKLADSYDGTDEKDNQLQEAIKYLIEK